MCRVCPHLARWKPTAVGIDDLFSTSAQQRGFREYLKRPQGRVATAHIGKQYLDSVGEIDRGVVTGTTCWGGRARLLPAARHALHPHHFPRGKNDFAFRTKLQIGTAPAWQAKVAGVVLRAVGR